MERGEDLRERTKAYALRILRLCGSLDARNAAQHVLAGQLIKSGTSPGANYREACRARSRAEFHAKAGICLQELDESSYWLDLLAEVPCGQNAEIRDLLAETDELIRIFTAICRKTDKN